MQLATIALFTYKKLIPLKSTVNALKKNKLAEESELVIFSDEGKNNSDKIKVNNVRDFLKTIQGFKKITIYKANTNKGLATSIIDGVSEILKNNERVIVMEDDLVSSPNFLSFMNEALENYHNNPLIFSIAGYSPPIKDITNYPYDNYFTKRASSWGWATYKNQWNKIDWDIIDYNIFKYDRIAKKKFNYMGSDMVGMLKKQMTGKLDSWAIRWCYHQFKNDLYTVYPITSKIKNIGFNEDATHTNNNGLATRFETKLDISNQLQFNWDNNVLTKKRFIKDFIKPYSIKKRIFFKIKNILLNMYQSLPLE